MPSLQRAHVLAYRRLAACCAALLVVTLAWPARAASDPDLSWWTIETKHFRIHYEQGLEAAATDIARLAEDIHRRLIGPLGYVPKTVTHITLTDTTDSANGSATAAPFNSIRLFITAPSDLSTLNDYDDWYLGLLTHEYTHILHVDNISGVPAIVNAVLGKTYVPNQAQPRWFIEGLAVVAESEYSSAGRIRSSIYDAYLRADVLDGRFARLDEMSSNPKRWPGGTLWYLYGSRFLQWIVDIYGRDVLRAVSADYGASIVPFGINRAIRRQTGRTYEDLYRGFKKQTAERYARQMRRVKARGLREGRRVTHHGREVYYPRFVPASARSGARYQLAYYRDDGDHRSGIYRLDIAAGPPRDELWVRAVGDGPVAFTAAGDLLLSSVVPYRNHYRRSELLHVPRGKTATRGTERHRTALTSGLRATAPTVNQHGDVVFTVNHRGGTTLHRAKLDNGRLTERRVLAPSKHRFDQAFTPRFSPDGMRVAYSVWTAGGFRDVRVIELDSGRVTEVTRDRALDTGPCWSPDGDKLYFASDRTGIFNIYEHTLATGETRQVTNVRTMAVMPAVSDDGKLLAYVGYTSAGYDLYVMPLDPALYLKARPPPRERPVPLPKPPRVKLVKRPYNPWPTLRPHAYEFEYAPGNFGKNALTLRASGRDVAGHHSIAFAFVGDPAAPLPRVALEYGYGRLPVDLSLRLSNRVTPRRDYRFNNKRPDYVEEAYSVVTGVSYRHAHELATQSYSLSYTYSILDASLPVASAGPLDPYAGVAREPLRGTIAVAHLGYGLSTVEYGYNVAGPARGVSLFLGLDVADQALGSQETLYSANYSLAGYIPMPWPGHHTLAIRSAGGMSKGSYSRRGTFFVGGYNLENTDVLDQLTAGIFNGAFVLRGYPPGAYAGSAYILNNVEYRLPIATIDRGPSTVPLYLRRVDGNLFFDYGGAFDRLRGEDVELFSEGDIIKSDQLHTGVGAEVWLGTTIGYVVDLDLRLGYALGLSNEAVPGGQIYFIASSPF